MGGGTKIKKISFFFLNRQQVTVGPIRKKYHTTRMTLNYPLHQVVK